MLQARPAAIGEERVAAITDPEQFLQPLQRLAHCAGIGKWPEIAPRLVARAAVKRQFRKLVISAQMHVREALVIPQHHVEPWPMLFDEVVFEQQRLDSECVTVTSMAAICCTSACTLGVTLLGLK